ncbi:MAG: SLC13 family permease [Geminicoccaceae bacterium]
MSTDQAILFALLGLVFVFLIWGRWRYDLVAFTALLIALIAGVVPTEEAFSGFGHPATVIVALVLIVSRGLFNSGASDLLARQVLDASRSLGALIAIMGGVAAGLSAVMNNVAALAFLMPLDLQAANKAKRSAALTLMPLSFASILGGMITLIGTPPNIIIAGFRGDALGQPFTMFDFTPVGLACAAAGLVFVTTIGWRLIPSARTQTKGTDGLFEIDDYIAEVRIAEGSKSIDKTIAELEPKVEAAEGLLLGVIRGGQRLPVTARHVKVRDGDMLVLEAAPSAIDKIVGELELEYIGTGKDRLVDKTDLSLVEVVVPEGSRIARRNVTSLGLTRHHGISLLGVSRRGRRFRERLGRVVIEPGDILLLLGPLERLNEVARWLGCLPLAQRGLDLAQRDKAWMAVGVFALAIVSASTGLLDLPIALACVCVAFVVMEIVPLRQLYESVEWSVIVLLAAMIPIGAALEASGGTRLIADGIIDLTLGFPAWAVLTILMVVTMSLSDVMNNTATAVIAAPIAIDMADRLEVSPDPFLMTVAVAASCAFLTPIGHKNNTLILGPGGYQFGDYWRMGLPLELLLVSVSIPMILFVWPL